ncbi:MAG: hypothetical protein M3220_04585 [Chloroflexota bacterium]|nr:hypothetical protein [Chloroflexota bacterium]
MKNRGFSLLVVLLLALSLILAVRRGEDAGEVAKPEIEEAEIGEPEIGEEVIGEPEVGEQEIGEPEISEEEIIEEKEVVPLPRRWGA